MPRAKLNDKQRCDSRYEGKRTILRCNKRRGHESDLHTNDTPGFAAVWSDDEAVKVAA